MVAIIVSKAGISLLAQFKRTSSGLPMPISSSGKPIANLNHGTVFQPMDGNEFCSPPSALCTGSPFDMNKPHLIVLDR
jgi:hypothetical protein